MYLHRIEARISKKNITLIFGAIVVLTATRIWLLLIDVIPFNSDEAIIALMAKHILGGARPVFFYGQSYLGSLGAYLNAAGFLVFGEHVVVMRVIQILIYLGTMLTTVALGWKSFGTWQIGLLAAWFLAIPTVNVTLYTTASFGYGEMLFIGNLILWVGLIIAGRLEEKERFGIDGLWLVWGFLVGLGFWAFALTLVFSLPTALFLLWKLWKSDSFEQIHDNFSKWKQIIRIVVIVLAGFLIGAMPLLVDAINHGFSEMIAELQGGPIIKTDGVTWYSQILQHIVNLVLLGITVILGLRPPWDVKWLVLPAIPFVLFFWGVVFYHLGKRLKLKTDHYPEALLLIGVILMLILGFIFTPFGADPTGRYFLPITVPLALFSAEAIFSLRHKWGSWAYGLLLFLLSYNLLGTVQSALTFPPGLTTQFDAITQIDHRYDQELIDFLIEQDTTRGYSNYWVAYPLAFQTDESLIFVPKLPYKQNFHFNAGDDKYEPYDTIVRDSENIAYITTHHLDLDEVLESSFSQEGVSYQEKYIGDFHVFYQFSRPVRPEEVFSYRDEKLRSLLP